VPQPEPHHFHLAHLIAPALDGVLRAVSDRGNQTEAQRAARSDDAETLIMSLQPCDAIDLMLSGQLVMFNELLADAARDVLRGMLDTMKQRSLSTLVAMARVTQGHVDRLEKRGIQPHRTEVAKPKAEPAAAPPPTPEPAKCPVAAASPPAAKASSTPGAVKPAQPSAAAGQTSMIVPEPARSAPTTESPAAETSWLDAPHPEWRIEIPADLAHRAAKAGAPEDLAPAKPANRGNGVIPARIPEPPEPAFPVQPAGTASVRSLMDAAAAGD
jgi:hypothetical protein